MMHVQQVVQVMSMGMQVTWHACMLATMQVQARDLADKALASFVIIQAALKRSRRLHHYTLREDLNKRMPNFQVSLCLAAAGKPTCPPPFLQSESFASGCLTGENGLWLACWMGH
jgi:hypothetical protein